MKKLLITTYLSIISIITYSADILIEAESFKNKGGWVVDQQFMDLMGSPYLMAHGMGKPVADATTDIKFTKAGRYSVFVRTYNWTSPWYNGEGAGKFALIVGDKKIAEIGDKGSKWEWQKAGEVDIKNLSTTVKLHDLTGFNGRCDAIYFTQSANIPPSDMTSLSLLRKKSLGTTNKDKREYDFVVVGGGVAGMCAAMSAARNGLKVALINDRPVLGGNNSSEIRVHLGGRVNMLPYPNLGNMLREFGASKEGNAKPADYYEDSKKEEWIAAEKNITTFPSYRVLEVIKKGNKIISVTAKHIETSKEIVFTAPIFSDCTGDGTVGYLAGADFMMGRESRSEFNEKTAPERGDKMTMGASVQWYSTKKDNVNTFSLFKYGININEANTENVTMGEWTWETGMNKDQITEFEQIRDYGLMVIFSNWSFLKNESANKANYASRELEWVAYVAGKRESRRLIGDYILTENDITGNKIYDDATASTTWSIDLHYPDPENSKNFPDAEFKSIAKHIVIHPYPIPYRCLYTKDIDNLFMAGRNISVTHVALGTTRVMRTTAMMGEVVGMAAALCYKHNTIPRAVYTDYLSELKVMMTMGAGVKDVPDNQKYNQGATLLKSK